MKTTNEKIAQLRAAMQAAGANACLIPSSDPHSSEYLPDHWKARAYFSGFTGSMGTLVVTDTASALWADGRYFIQAERQLFVLAAYNGGYFHVQDAMALARKNGRNPHRWKDVAYYILALEKPEFYNDPVVRHGYMRGSETVGYVDGIRQRYAQYRGVPYGGASVKGWDGKQGAGGSFSPFTPRKAKRKHRFHI